MSRIKIDTSDPETKATFEAAKEARDEVRSWPKWKGGDGLREQQERRIRCSLEDAIGMLNFLHGVINLGGGLSPEGVEDLEFRIEIYRRALNDWPGGKR